MSTVDDLMIVVQAAPSAVVACKTVEVATWAVGSEWAWLWSSWGRSVVFPWWEETWGGMRSLGWTPAHTHTHTHNIRTCGSMFSSCLSLLSSTIWRLKLSMTTQYCFKLLYTATHVLYWTVPIIQRLQSCTPYNYYKKILWPVLIWLQGQ